MRVSSLFLFRCLFLLLFLFLCLSLSLFLSRSRSLSLSPCVFFSLSLSRSLSVPPASPGFARFGRRVAMLSVVASSSLHTGGESRLEQYQLAWVVTVLCQFVVLRNLWPGRSQSVRRVRCSRRWPRRSYTRAARDRQLCAAVTVLCKALLGRGETDRAVQVVCSCDSGLQTRCVQLCGCESEVVSVQVAQFHKRLQRVAA